MREPDTRFLQLLPHDRSVRRDIGSIDLHFPCWALTGGALSNAVLVCACSAMAKDSFAQSIGAEWVQLSILAGVIVFISSVAASPTSSPTALRTKQVWDYRRARCGREN
jgi:hypothetical protein